MRRPVKAPAAGLAVGLAAIGLTAGLGAPAAAREPALTGSGPGGEPHGSTWWVSPTARATLRRHPRSGAPSVGRLHLFTEDGFPEVDVVSTEEVDRSGRLWLRVLQPTKPRAVAGWAPAQAFGPLQVVHTRFVVDRATERATLYRDGRAIWRGRVGVGKASTPTPPGSYWIREKFTVPGDGLYGSRAFGTSDYSPYETDWPGGGIVGIHGTDEPALIPGRPSHGCIRIRNPEIQRLYPLMGVGTPVVIH